MSEPTPQPGARKPSRRGTTHLPTKPPEGCRPPAPPDEMSRRVAAIVEQIPRFVGSKMALRQWAADELGLTPSQVDVAMRHVNAAMKDLATEKAEDTRVRLLAIIDAMLPKCWTYKTGAGPKGEGTILLSDPETGELLREVDHGAIQRYIEIIAELTGIRKTPLVIQQPYVVTLPQPASDPATWAREVQAEIRQEEKKQ